MRSSTPLRVGGLALAGIVIASVAVISASGGDTSAADRIALASVRRGTVTSYVSAAGNTVDTGVRDLAFGAAGTVEKVYVTVGEKVRRGKVLARVDDTIARENYEAAKAALAAARETLDDVENGAAATGGAAAPSAGGSGAGTSGGEARSGSTGPGAGTSGGGTGSGAGSGNAGGSGGGAVVCPTPSARPSGPASTHPSPKPSSKPSSQPSSRSSAQPAAQPSSRTAAPAAHNGASTVSVSLVAYEGGDHDGDHGSGHDGDRGGPKPEPSPTPTATPTPRPHPHPNPSGTRRPTPRGGATAAPDPQVSVSILPTTPAQRPSATPSPSSSGSSSTCAPGQGGQGQGGQGQGSRGQGAQGQSGGTQGRASFGGQSGQAGQGRQVGQSSGGQGGQAGQGGGARLTEAQAEAQVSQTTTELAEAKKALAGVRIKAPADGTVLSVAGTTGSHYTSGTFITLGDLDALQVQALFTESDIRYLKVGQAATVTLPTQPGREYPGTVAHIDPTATTTNRLVRYGVTIDLDTRPARLLLGQSATVRVTIAEAADALYVPAQAVRAQSDGTAVVTVADGGTQARRTVKVGVRGDTYVEITGGLSEGDQIVLPATSTDFPDKGFPDEGFPAAR